LGISISGWSAVDLEGESLELSDRDTVGTKDVGRVCEVGAALSGWCGADNAGEGPHVSANHVTGVKVERLQEGTALPVGITDRLIPQYLVECTTVEAAPTGQVRFEREGRIGVRL